MNRNKILSVIFAVFTFGAIQESFRIFTSHAPDIANNRSSLIPMAVIITAVFAWLALLFWKRSTKK
jgi:hypothetical protein